MNVQVNIPKIGKQYGTCAWVADYLNNLEFEFKKMREGGVALYYRVKDSGNKWNWFASPQTWDNMGGDSYKDFACLFPYHENYDFEMLFGHPLTPAAFDYTQRFICEVVDRFAEQWEGDSLP